MFIAICYNNSGSLNFERDVTAQPRSRPQFQGQLRDCYEAVEGQSGHRAMRIHVGIHGLG